MPRLGPCSFRWFIVAESTIRWFVVREKHCWMAADSADPAKRTGCDNFSFRIHLEDFTEGEFTTDDLALDHLLSLQSVHVGLYRGNEKIDEEVVMDVQEKLRQKGNGHPNHPSIVPLIFIL
jgi:disease resistance protein RPM1